MTCGLPCDVDLRELARTYLGIQRRLWLELVKAGRLRELTDENVNCLVDDHKGRFLTRHCNKHLAVVSRTGPIAGCYDRRMLRSLFRRGLKSSQLHPAVAAATGECPPEGPFYSLGTRLRRHHRHDGRSVTRWLSLLTCGRSCLWSMP